MPLSQLLAAASLRPQEVRGPDVGVTGIALDSRAIASGMLFAAVAGHRQDGHRYVPQALERGASGIVSDRDRPAGLDPGCCWVRVDDVRRAVALLAREWHQRPDEAMKLIGVTGTNGKTSVVCLIEAIARAAGERAGRIGTIGWAFDGIERPAARTTPEAPDLYAWLAARRDDGATLVAMEVSSHALALERVHGARFRAGAFLNLSRDHLDFHDGMEDYFRAKARLLEGLSGDDALIVPGDDPWGRRLAEGHSGPLLRFGAGEGCEVRIVDPRATLDGTRCRLVTPAGTIELESPLVGRFVVDNLAAAAAGALAVGLPAEAVRAGAAALTRVAGRMERIDCGQPFAVFVDYAHTDQALERLLSGLREIASGRLIVVFGCGGGRDAGKRPEMGRVAVEHADLALLTSDNPRDEDPDRILADVDAGARSVDGGTRHRVVVDRAQAIEEALAEARTGDVVVIAGKGHETTQERGGLMLPFDDREISRAALVRMGHAGNTDARA